MFITGMGVVSPLGTGLSTYWSGLKGGESGAAPITAFDTTGIGRDIGCEAKGFHVRDHLRGTEARTMGRASAMVVAATRMAADMARLKSLPSPERTAAFLGTTMGEGNLLAQLHTAWITEGAQAVAPQKILQYGGSLLSIHAARTVGAQGPAMTLPAACAAGNYAIGYSADQIRQGMVDMAITGAAEVLERAELAGFARLGAVAKNTCRPFDKDRDGILVGEGAAILVLESESHMRARGAEPLAEVGGYGLACDGHHVTHPNPEGAGNARAMGNAIRTSGLTPSDVDHVNAHGTGTPTNDPVESQVIRKVFGAHDVAVTSVKSMIGHCMGAASALEAVACVQSVRTGWVPPTINHGQKGPECDVRVIANQAQRLHPKVVLNNALAFGGYNAVVTFAAPDVLPPVSDRPLATFGDDHPEDNHPKENHPRGDHHVG